ncbi:MAG: alanine dehydrogenase [Crocinitomicaceae bacterium]|nr:alanine dehydrogenase [Crocinitomicaceae bacterium]
MITDPEALKSLMKEGSLLPQKKCWQLGVKKGKLVLEFRVKLPIRKIVALSPDAVQFLSSNGHRILVESKAGESSRFTDNDYSEAGAEIAYDKSEVFKATIIIKVAPPSDEEIEMMPGNQTLISALQLTLQPKKTLVALMRKNYSVAQDYIQDEHQIFPVVRAMGEIAGNTSILIAAELLSNSIKPEGIMMAVFARCATNRSSNFGAGTMGRYACRTAMGLGASVKVFDNSISKLRRLQNDIGQRIFTSVIQPKLLEKAIMRADVVIGAVRAPFGRTPCIVTEGMVKGMKAGSVIVDVSIDQGGCFETSRVTNHTKPTFVEHDVIHYCVPNVASRVSRTASIALSNIFSQYFQKWVKWEVQEMIKRDPT